MENENNVIDNVVDSMDEVSCDSVDIVPLEPADSVSDPYVEESSGLGTAIAGAATIGAVAYTGAKVLIAVSKPAYELVCKLRKTEPLPREKKGQFWRRTAEETNQRAAAKYEKMQKKMAKLRNKNAEIIDAEVVDEEPEK